MLDQHNDESLSSSLQDAQRLLAALYQLHVAYRYEAADDLIKSHDKDGPRGHILSLEMLAVMYPVAPANLSLEDAMEVAKEELETEFPEHRDLIRKL